MAKILRIYKSSSRRGKRAIDRLERRGEKILDHKTLRRAERIVDRVERGGDRALRRLVAKYDDVDAPSVAALRHRPERAAAGQLPAGFAEALEQAIDRVRRYHRQQRHDGGRLESDGIELVELRRPLQRVGVYVPGGRATYPSTAVMTVVPARVAGVAEIVVMTPPRALESPALRHALALLEVDEVWGVGGAHAIAAMAYGTATIRRVDKIVGPGNALVTAAKHLVSPDVAIDGLAGPSEVVIVAAGNVVDGGGAVDPELIAADLLAQAEHDPQALALLITDRAELAKRVAVAVAEQLPALATAEVARRALRGNGGALLVADPAEALELVERIAPEHLQLVGEPAEALAERVRNAGAIFVGAATPEVFGDYLAGPSHVLPTAGTARFASALGVEDFIRRSHRLRYGDEAAAGHAAAVAALAEAEGLPAHAAAARRRLGGSGG